MHGCSSGTSVAHGEDDGGSTANDISAGIGGGESGEQGVVDNESAAAGYVEALESVGNKRVGRYADANHNDVDVDFDNVVGDGHWGTTAGSVGFAELHAL